MVQLFHDFSASCTTPYDQKLEPQMTTAFNVMNNKQESECKEYKLGIMMVSVVRVVAQMYESRVSKALMQNVGEISSAGLAILQICCDAQHQTPTTQNWKPCEQELMLFVIHPHS